MQRGRSQSNVQQIRTRCGQQTEPADAVRTAGTNFLSAPSLVGTLFSQQEWNGKLINEDMNNLIDHTYEANNMNRDKAKTI